MNKSLYRPLVAIIIALAVPIIPFAIIGEIPGEKWLSGNNTNDLVFALAGSTLLALDIILPVPSSIIGSLLGARLGLIPGFFSTLIGLTVGHTCGYLVGRLTLGRLGAKLPEAPTLLAVFLSRPVPVLAEAMTLTAGATSVPFTPFLLSCLSGNIIFAAFLAANGASFIASENLAAGIVVAMLLSGISWLGWKAVSKYRKRDSSAANQH